MTTMYVCICKDVTDADIKDAVDSGAKTLRDLYRSHGVGSQCGKCTCVAREVIRDHSEELKAREAVADVAIFDPRRVAAQDQAERAA